MTPLPDKHKTALAQGWAQGKTVADLQDATGLSRLSVVRGLKELGIEPSAWRERNRRLGKALGPVSALKGFSASLAEDYGKGMSLADVADKYHTSRSSARRALVQAGFEMRPRGRPLKGLPRV